MSVVSSVRSRSRVVAIAAAATLGLGALGAGASAAPPQPRANATISGVVFSTGIVLTPKAGVRVALFNDYTGVLGTPVVTNSSGGYAFSVPAGIYRVAIVPTLTDTYRQSVSVAMGVAEGESRDVPMIAYPGAQLSGKVVSSAGRPISGIDVYAYDIARTTTTPLGRVFGVYAKVSTGLDGGYVFKNLDPTEVKIYYASPSNASTRYESQWYSNTDSADTARKLAVSPSSPRVLPNVTMTALPGTPGTFEGSVNGQYTGLSGVDVRLTTEDGSITLYSTKTTVTGSFTIANVVPGIYGVDVVPGPNAEYVASYGDLVTIVGGDTTQRTYTLQRGAQVSGTIKDSQGRPLAGVKVEAVNAVTYFPEYFTVATTTSGANGQYYFPALPVGTELTFYYSANDLTTYYAPQWYGGSATLANAEYISPASGVSTQLNDTTMVSGTRPTGGLSGQVKTMQGGAIDNVTVSAFSDSGVLLASAVTDDYGTYTLSGLPAGPVYLQATDNPAAMPGYIGEWYLNAATRASATPYTVVANQVKTPVAFELEDGVGIRGDVIDYDTDAPVEATVRLVEKGGASYTINVTTGSYSIGQLPAGTYQVQVTPKGGYLAMWWENKATQAQATSIELESGDTQTANFWLSKVPADPVITSVKKGAPRTRNVTIKWQATVGAGKYQLQRQQANKWVAVTTTTAVSFVDKLPATIPWASQVCYRLRVVASTGVVGPWAQECT